MQGSNTDPTKKTEPPVLHPRRHRPSTSYIHARLQPRRKHAKHLILHCDGNGRRWIGQHGQRLQRAEVRSRRPAQLLEECHGDASGSNFPSQPRYLEDQNCLNAVASAPNSLQKLTWQERALFRRCASIAQRPATSQEARGRGPEPRARKSPESQLCLLEAPLRCFCIALATEERASGSC